MACTYLLTAHKCTIFSLYLGMTVLLTWGCGGQLDDRDLMDCAGRCELSSAGEYQVGTGKQDITGPLGLPMMGWGWAEPLAQDIHRPLFSRAFVIMDPGSGRRVALVTADLGQVFQSVHLAVLAQLAEDPELRDEAGEPLYTAANVLISATHTHSGPMGYSHSKLYNTTSTKGVPRAREYYSAKNFAIITKGITRSIVEAHQSLQPATLSWASGTLAGLGKNRSLSAYLRNPEADGAPESWQTNQTMTLLRFDDREGNALGVLNWFALHGTSLGNDNTSISGDNKGEAARLFEMAHRAVGQDFVAAFAQSDCGDVSPNTMGDVDGDGDWDGEGGADDRLSLEIAGRKQFERATELFEAAAPLAGKIDHRQTYVDFSGLELEVEVGGESRRVTTCPAAVGQSMSAGTEDGRGFTLLFAEGMTCDSNSFWVPAPECWAAEPCHGAKAVMIGTPRGSDESPGMPQILPLQLITLGGLAIVAVPAELTTVAGHRLRQSVAEALGPSIKQVVIAGLANTYAGYVTTREEYQQQDYEGGSTLFGEHTLAAYQQQFQELARALVQDEPVTSDLRPLDLSGDWATEDR